MDSSRLRLGGMVVLLWIAVTAILVSNYRVLGESHQRITELRNAVEELRSTFHLSSAYRPEATDQQELNLQLIYALQLQIEANYEQSWYSPDVSQLLFSLDKYIAQAKAYLDNDLLIQELIETIKQARGKQADSPLLTQTYYRLSVLVLEEVFGTHDDSPRLSREMDSIYVWSTELEGAQQQELQRVLALVAQVLGTYAKGLHLVEGLVGHDVNIQIASLGEAYHQSLERHVQLGLVSSALAITALVLLVMSARTAARSRLASNEPMVEHHKRVEVDKKENELEEVESPMEPEPIIDTQAMLSSLNGDTASVCMLLEVFVEDHQDDVSTIEGLIVESPETALRKAHSLKGVGGNLGAPLLKQAAARVEKAIKETQTNLSDELNELQRVLGQAIDEAKQFLKVNQA